MIRSIRGVVGVTVGLAVLAVGLGMYSYLFKSEVRQVAGWGEIRFKWRWGKAVEMSIDRNEDGTVDLRALYSGKERDFYNHSIWTEYWLSRRCDGTFDVYFDLHSKLIVVDQDRDGQYESEISPEDLRRSLSQEPFSGCWGGAMPLQSNKVLLQGE
jgi:hypothetical protein